MTFDDAKLGAERAFATTVGKALVGAAITAVLMTIVALAGWTLNAVEKNGEQESKLEGEFHTLIGSIAEFQHQIEGRIAIDEAQTAQISDIRIDLKGVAVELHALEQAFRDHVHDDEAPARKKPTGN